MTGEEDLCFKEGRQGCYKSDEEESCMRSIESPTQILKYKLNDLHDGLMCGKKERRGREKLVRHKRRTRPDSSAGSSHPAWPCRCRDSGSRCGGKAGKQTSRPNHLGHWTNTRHHPLRFPRWSRRVFALHAASDGPVGGFQDRLTEEAVNQREWLERPWWGLGCADVTTAPRPRPDIAG